MATVLTDVVSLQVVASGERALATGEPAVVGLQRVAKLTVASHRRWTDLVLGM